MLRLPVRAMAGAPGRLANGRTEANRCGRLACVELSLATCARDSSSWSRPGRRAGVQLGPAPVERYGMSVTAALAVFEDQTVSFRACQVKLAVRPLAQRGGSATVCGWCEVLASRTLARGRIAEVGEPGHALTLHLEREEQAYRQPLLTHSLVLGYVHDTRVCCYHGALWVALRQGTDLQVVQGLAHGPQQRLRRGGGICRRHPPGFVGFCDRRSCFQRANQPRSGSEPRRDKPRCRFWKPLCCSAASNRS